MKTRELSFCLAQKTAKKRKRVRKRLILKGPTNATNCSQAQEVRRLVMGKGLSPRSRRRSVTSKVQTNGGDIYEDKYITR